MKSLLLAWIAFSGLALIALNYAVLTAWIAIKRHEKVLQRLLPELLRVDRQSQGVSEATWAEFQQQRLEEP